MTITELKHQAITLALKKYNGNVKKAAKPLGITSRTIFTFKAEQKQLKQK